MSVQAITWALEDAPDVPARLVSTLIALANYANRQGCGAFPGNDTLADHTRKSPRQVKRDLEELVELKLIRAGDEKLVTHMRADRRPRVWDLAVERKQSRGDTHDTPRGAADGPRGVTDDMSSMTDQAPRGDTHDTPQAPRGVIQGRHGVSPMTPDPKEEPKPSLSTEDVERASRRRAGEARARGPVLDYAELSANAYSTGAWSIVNPWKASHRTRYRSRTYREIAKEVDLILADNGVPHLITVALHDWDTRGKSPGFLRYCYDDAVHATRPKTPEINERDAAAMQYLGLTGTEGFTGFTALPGGTP